MSMADRIAVLAAGRVQQVATPLELYRQPANLFVADFIGTSNLLPGPGDGEHLVVRPEAVRLVAPGEGRLEGTVADTQFQGGTSSVAVDVPGRERPFLVTLPGATEAVRGTSVGLAWEDAVVVREGLA